MIEGKYLYFNDDLTDSFDIRRKVFQIEQSVKEEIEFDEFDKKAIHAIVYDNKHPVATARLVLENETFHIGRVAVLKEERGKKYGDFVVRMLIEKAFIMGASDILISSQMHAIIFYEKIGFVSYGDEYEEAGIPHKKMRLTKGNICKRCSI